MMNWTTLIRRWLEFLGGATDEAPGPLPARVRWILTALWWTVLALLIATFCGQSSKFIYIDF